MAVNTFVFKPVNDRDCGEIYNNVGSHVKVMRPLMLLIRNRNLLLNPALKT